MNNRQIFEVIHHAIQKLKESELSQLQSINLSEETKDVTNLMHNFSLSLRNLHIKGYEDYSIDISQFPNLERLYWKQDKEADPTIPQRMFSSLSSLVHLKDLTLKFACTFFIEQGFFKTLFEDLSLHNNFSQLIIIVSDKDVKKQTVQEIILNLPLLNKLKHLKLYFPTIQIQNYCSFSGIWKQLCSFEALESFDINVNLSKDENLQNDLKQQIEGKSILKTLKTLRILEFDINKDKYQLLLDFVSLFECLESLCIHVGIQQLYIQLPIPTSKLLQNNRSSLKQLEFIQYHQTHNDEPMNNNLLIDLNDNLKDLKYLERLSVIENKEISFSTLLSQMQNLKSLKNLVSLKQVVIFNQEEQLSNNIALDIFQNIMDIPYLTHLLLLDVIEIRVAQIQQLKANIEVFDNSNDKITFTDPLVVEKLYSKHKFQYQQQQISTKRLHALFINSFRNKTLLEHHLDQPWINQTQNQNQGKNSFQEQKVRAFDVKEKQYYHHNFFFKCRDCTTRFIQSKLLEVLKIMAYNQFILESLKSIIGDVAYINYNYWDLYV